MNNVVTELSEWIREYGHDPRHQERLLSVRFNWHQLWTALDVIEDIELAISAYETGEFPTDPGEQYLRVYGLLQALFVQGYALEHFVKAIRPGMSINGKDLFKEIRENRNAAIGHPTELGHKKGQLSTHLISRISMRKEGFDLMSFSESKGDAAIRYVTVRDLIEKQRTEMVRIMGDVVTHLKEEDAAHKATFRTKSLKQAFHLVPYAFEKISEEMRAGSVAILGAWAAGELQSALRVFEQLLKERGLSIETYDAVRYTYKDIEYPLAQLQMFLAKRKSDIPHSEAARVYADALQGAFSHLMDIAEEIDEEYSNEDQTEAAGSISDPAGSQT